MPLQRVHGAMQSARVDVAIVTPAASLLRDQCCDSSTCFRSAKSLRLARHIAIDINGVIHAAKPDGRPRFRSRIRVVWLSIDSHVYVVSIGNGPSAVRITR